jgi:hypothetical protein
LQSIKEGVMHIWFNLLLFTGGHLYWVDAFATLEECQEERAEHERSEPGTFFCRPVQVEPT